MEIYRLNSQLRRGSMWHWAIIKDCDEHSIGAFSVQPFCGTSTLLRYLPWRGAQSSTPHRLHLPRCEMRYRHPEDGQLWTNQSVTAIHRSDVWYSLLINAGLRTAGHRSLDSGVCGSCAQTQLSRELKSSDQIISLGYVYVRNGLDERSNHSDRWRWLRRLSTEAVQALLGS